MGRTRRPPPAVALCSPAGRPEPPALLHLAVVVVVAVAVVVVAVGNDKRARQVEVPGQVVSGRCTLW